MPIVIRSEHPSWLSNAYLIYDRPGGHGLVVDSGAPIAPILETARIERLTVPWILNTHFHHDHVEENAALAAALGARVGAHRLDAPRIAPPCEPLEDRQRLTAGELTVELLHIPGHTAGQAAFLVNGTELFTGDTLFRGSVGGCVGPGATSFEDLRRSLVERLLALPDQTAVHPGHTQPTKIGEERSNNPFLRIMLGIDPPGTGRCLALGRPARLILRARDYDGGTKAWVRFEEDGREATVPGSRVTDRA